MQEEIKAKGLAAEGKGGQGEGEGEALCLALTQVSDMPLDSPKRIVALQLANNNPLFRFQLSIFDNFHSLFLVKNSVRNLSRVEG